MRVLKREGFTEDELREIVGQVSSEQYEGNVILNEVRTDRGQVVGFTLRTVTGKGEGMTSAPGARRSWSGRRMPAACWHAHRDVLRAVFTEHPKAVIITAMARYKGLEGFENTYPDTAYKNIGSMMQPAYMPELCDC